MSSWKCMNCGIVNFATAEVCRRCQCPVTGTTAANPYAQPNFQQQNPPSNFPASHFAPQTNYQTANLSEGVQQLPANPYAQNNDYPQTGYSNGNSQPLNYPQGNNYQNINPAQGYNNSPNGGYGNNNPYGQSQSYPQQQNPAPPNGFAANN